MSPGGGSVTKRLFAALTLATLAAVVVSADNWPQWRGPKLDGTSPETSLPVKWSVESGENIAWKLAMPSRSGATPIVWGQQIFLNVATSPDSGEVELWSVNKTDGQVAWKRPIAPGNYKINKQNMSSPSPVTDGKFVWVLTGLGILKAFDVKGAELWTRDIQADYGKFGLNWGFASSPLLHQGALYVPVLHGMKTDDPSYLLKIDAKSGKTIWRVERPTSAIRESPDAYVTPALLQYKGTTEIVLNGGDVVTGHDPGTGKELWRVNGLNPDNNPAYRIIASTLIVGEMIVAPTRIRPMLAIKAGGRGDITASHVAWSFDKGPDVPTPVSDGKLLYVVDDRGVVHALDITSGAIVWGPERIAKDSYSASPTLADGKLYVTSETTGVTSVLRAGPKFELLGENPSGEYTLSTIAVSDGQLFLRTEKHLFAIGQRRNR
jgi:outer membrane protein assembly factor BamB